MRTALLAVLLLGLCSCDDEDAAYYADGTLWKAAMPVSPGAVLPRDMSSRQWSEFLSQSGIQADRSAKPFTPAWTGFSAAPVGDLSYFDFGTLVVLFWNDSGAL